MGPTNILQASSRTPMISTENNLIMQQPSINPSHKDYQLSTAPIAEPACLSPRCGANPTTPSQQASPPPALAPSPELNMLDIIANNSQPGRYLQVRFPLDRFTSASTPQSPHQSYTALVTTYTNTSTDQHLGPPSIQLQASSGLGSPSP